jgi:hypothetical protein
MKTEIVITFDIDWAPDFVIDFVAQLLIEYHIKATWFVTHISPAVQRLNNYPELFELGIHPNFRPGSSHGNTPEEVLQHCMKLVPNALSMRTHSLVQSSPLLAQIMAQTPIIRDVSLFLPHTPYIRPHEFWWNRHRLLRIPYYWEEDFEMQRPEPCWYLEPLLNIGEGLKIFNFHPIHIYLNSADMKPYNALRTNVPNPYEATSEQAMTFIQKGEGTQTIFKELIEYLSGHKGLGCIRDI